MTLEEAYNNYVKAGRLEYRPHVKPWVYAENLKTYRRERQRLCALLESEYDKGNLRGVHIDNIKRKIDALGEFPDTNKNLEQWNYIVERQRLVHLFHDILIIAYEKQRN